MIAIMSAQQTQKMAAFLVAKAVFRVVVTTFTFDLQPFCDVLVQAQERGVNVKIFCDASQALKGSTKKQVERLADMKSAGKRRPRSTGAPASLPAHC